MRTYKNIDEDGTEYNCAEYWTKKEVSYFKYFSNVDSIVVDNRITIQPDEFMTETKKVNTIEHGFGRVPFIFFNQQFYANT